MNEISARYEPGQHIPMEDSIALAKARFIVGDITLEQFERQIDAAIRGRSVFMAPGGTGGSMRRRLHVAVES